MQTKKETINQPECSQCARLTEALTACQQERDAIKARQAEAVAIYQKLESCYLAAIREIADARSVLNPTCEQETLIGAIRNLQQAHLSEKGNAESAEADLTACRAQGEAMRAALRKVRGHTSYAVPTPELLAGLLQSIERIADAALSSTPTEPKNEN